MGGIVDAVSDAVGSVVDAVGDAVEWVGDTAGKIVENALDHPVETALSIGVIAATGGAGAAALGLEAPLTALEASTGLAGVSGVSTLAQGGDLSDALTNAATTFAVSQGVSYAFDSFNASGTPDTTATTTQFSDTGTVTQNFADGSKLVTDSSGAVTPVTPEIPAPDLQGKVFDPATLSWKDAGDVTTNLSTNTNVPPVDVTPTTPPVAPAPTYDTMEQLLVDKGLITPDQAVAAVAPDVVPPNVPDKYDLMPDSVGNTPAFDPNAKTYDTMEDLLHDKGQITDAQYKDLTGQAPVVDLSKPAGPMNNVSTVDALKDLGGAVIDVAKTNPWTTAAVIGGGLAATGALGGGQPDQPTTPTDTTKPTYTYGAAPPINRTGLAQLYSAADKIYGSTPGAVAPVSQLVQAPQFQSNFQPVLAGPAPGAGNFGLGALGQGFSYTPMDRSQTYDISNMSPEQIVQLQQAVNRKRQG